MAKRQKLQVDIEATDKASGKIEAVDDKADKLDKKTATPKVDADTSKAEAKFKDLAGIIDDSDLPIDGIEDKLGKLASPGGAIAAVGAGFVLAADHAADMAIEADNLSRQTGDTVEDASRLAAVWKSSGADVKDLSDVLNQMSGVLDSDAELARKLGINLNDGATQGQRFQQVSDALDEIPDAAERSLIAAKVFGEEGVRQYTALRGSVDDVGEAMANVADGQVIDEDDVENARKFKKELGEVKAQLEGIVAEIGQGVLPRLANMTGALGEVVEAADKLKVLQVGEEILKWANPVKAIGDELKGPVVDGIESAGKAIKGWFGKGGEAEEAFKATTTAQDQYVESLEALDQARERAQEATIRQTEVDAKYRQQARDIADDLERRGVAALEAKQRADEEATEAAEEHAQVLREVAEAMDAQHSAALELVGGDIAVRNAQREAKTAAEELTTTLEDQDLTLEDVAAAVDEATAAQLDAANQAADYRAKQMEANGTTVDAQVKAQLLKEELQRLADGLTGPLRDAVLGYIDQLNAIPRNINTHVTITSSGGRVSDNPALNRGGPGQVTVGAEGAIVRRPTLALIGEAGDEAVVPLHKVPGNQPVESLFGATSSSKRSGPTQMRVEIDGKTLFKIMWDETERQARSGWRPGPGVRRVMGA